MDMLSLLEKEEEAILTLVEVGEGVVLDAFDRIRAVYQKEYAELELQTQREVIPEYNIGEVVYQETEYLQSLVPFDSIGDVAASLERIEDAINRRIAELEKRITENKEKK